MLPPLPTLGQQAQPPIDPRQLSAPPTAPTPPRPPTFGPPQGAQGSVLGDLASYSLTGMMGPSLSQAGPAATLLAPWLGQQVRSALPALPTFPAALPQAAATPTNTPAPAPTAPSTGGPKVQAAPEAAVTAGSGGTDYRAVAAQAAQTYGVPSSFFTALIQQESGFNPSAVSPAGALGIAQMMPATAQGWGVDPTDPEASLYGAAKALKQYYDATGSWVGAAVSYNAGPGGWQNYHQTGFLPDETRRYVKAILGIDL